MKRKKYYSIKECAEIFKVTPQKVYRLVYEKQVIGERFKKCPMADTFFWRVKDTEMDKMAKIFKKEK